MRRIALLLMLAAGCAESVQVPAGMPAGRLALLWTVPTTDVALGEPVRLQLWVRVAAGIDAEAPDVAASYGKLEGGRLDAVGPGAWSGAQDAERVWTRGYTLQWFRLGTRTLPPLELKARDGESDLTAVTEEIEFEVAAVLPEGASPGAEVPVDLIADPPPRPLWPWLLGAALLAVLVWLFLLLRRRRRMREPAPAPTVMVPPDQLALSRLKELERMLADGQIGGERLVVEVSSVLRRWLHTGLGLHALDRTTEEFLHDLGAGTRLPVALRNLLTAFLEQCDLVKFAAQHPGLEQCRSLLVTARDFVLTTSERSAAEQPAVVGASDG